MFNFGVEHQFTNSLKGEIQYIGQFGFGLFGEQDYQRTAGYCRTRLILGSSSSAARPNPLFDAVRTNTNSRTSSYNGLLASVNKNFSNHVQFNASYTWSHALTSGEDFFGISEPGDWVNVKPERANALNDVRHAANMGVVLDSGKLTTNQFLGWVANNLGLSWIGQTPDRTPLSAFHRHFRLWS